MLTLFQDDRFVRANKPRETLYNDIIDTRFSESAIAILDPKVLDHDYVGPAKCAWREIPSAYILCEEDRVLVPAVTEAMVDLVKSEGVEVQTHRLRSGHAPMLSKPKEAGLAIVKLIES